MSSGWVKGAVCAGACSGCMAAEMETGDPLFPGDNDVDQLWLILKCTGALTPQHAVTLSSNPFYAVRPTLERKVLERKTQGNHSSV